MVCPYAVNREIVQQSTREYNTDSVETFYNLIENNTATMLPCKKEECGAWQEGKCCYNAK